MLSILCVRLMIKVKVGIPESFKVGWYSLKKTGSSHLKLIYRQVLLSHSGDDDRFLTCAKQFAVASLEKL